MITMYVLKMKVAGVKGIFKSRETIKIRSKKLKQVKLNWVEENKFNHATNYHVKKKKKASGYEKPRFLLTLTANIR